MENRFLEMNTHLGGLRKNKKQTMSFTKSYRLFSSSFEAINYEAPGIVAPVQQPSGMVCWATVATMMISWQRQQSMSIETAIGSVGQTWLQKFRNNAGLGADEKIAFLNASGFQFEYPQSLSIAGWEQMLRNFGPIWVTTDEDPSINFAIHARILSALHGDGTPEGTYLKITDPGTGTQYEERFSNFLRKYEDEVRTSGQSWSGRIQIVHWAQQGASRAKSFSDERTQSWPFSQQGLDMIKYFEGFRGNLYNDPVGHCTVGYGELVHHGNCNGDASEQPYLNGVTEQRASEILSQKLNDFQRVINEIVTVELNQNQFDSLVSFAYNVGTGNLRQSTLLRQLNHGNYNAVPTEMRKWTKGRVNGKLVDLPGLVTRRNAEAELFSNSSYATGQSYYSPRSYAQSAINIHYMVPLVPQPDNTTCWAASSAMVLSYWRDAANRSSSPAYTTQKIKDMVRSVAPQINVNGGLAPQDTTQVGDILGLAFDAPMCYGVDGFAAVLRSRGPIVFIRASMGGKGAHAIVITGMGGDGTPDGTTVETLNPSPVGTGASQNVTFTNLMSMMEQLGFWDQTDWSKVGGLDRVYVMYRR